MEATLELFGCIPIETEEDGKEATSKLLEQYGIVVRGEVASPRYLKHIESWVKEKRVSGEDLNKAFHKSWNKIINSSQARLKAEQILHYLSTYGLQSLGINDSRLIYIPSEELDIPETLPLKIIIGAPKEEIIKRNFNLLNGKALKRETINMVLQSLEECDYSFTGEEEIANKEAAVLIFDKMGTRPVLPEMLFRYIFFKATGETLVIKNKFIYKQIDQLGYSLPSFSEEEMIRLSETFNRHKPIWMAIKGAADKNRPIVNKISKYSKKYHRPKSVNVLETLTSSKVPQEEIKKAASSAPTSHLIKAINAVGEYKLEPYHRFYRIRNGKGWAIKESNLLTTQCYLNNQAPLLKELSKRLNTKKKVYCPNYINYALPISEKQYLGNFPSGTRIDISEKGDTLLIGVYWEGERIDLDLSATSLSRKVGWNSNFKTGDNGLMYSGDITSAPEGAAEWLYSKSIDCPYLINLNLYNGEVGQPFKFIIGFSQESEIEENYMIDPNKVLLQVDCEVVQEQTTLGLLIPEENGIALYLSGQGTNNSRVSGGGDQMNILLSNLVAKSQSMLRLGELPLNYVDDPQDAQLDLSPSAISRDSIDNIFK